MLDKVIPILLNALLVFPPFPAQTHSNLPLIHCALTFLYWGEFN
jgi:hypothetical protein